MEIYVVYSRVNDECSCNNGAFKDYYKACAYAQEVEKDSGCKMYIIGMKLEE
jgi:hypothetical protein